MKVERTLIVRLWIPGQIWPWGHEKFLGVKKPHRAPRPSIVLLTGVVASYRQHLNRVLQVEARKLGKPYDGEVGVHVLARTHRQKSGELFPGKGQVSSLLWPTIHAARRAGIYASVRRVTEQNVSARVLESETEVPGVLVRVYAIRRTDDGDERSTGADRVPVPGDHQQSGQPGDAERPGGGDPSDLGPGAGRGAS